MKMVEVSEKAPPIGNRPPGKFWRVDTIKGLVAELNRHYQGRLIINYNKLSDWKRRQNLPDPDIPAPPSQVNGGRLWDVEEYIAWTDKYILPHYSSANGKPVLPLARLQQMEMDDKLAELEQKEKRRQIEDGKYYTREEVAAAADAIGAKLKSALLENYEKLFERKLIENVNALNLEEMTRQKLIEQLRDTGRTGTDAILAALSEKLKV